LIGCGDIPSSPSQPETILLAVGSTYTRYPPVELGIARTFSSPGAIQGGGTMLAERVNRWIAEYKAEGKAEGMASILRRMKKKGMSIAEIAQITGLSEDEIQHMI